MLAQRVVSAVVLAPLVLLVVAVGGLWYLAFAVVVSMVAGWEFYSLLRRAGYAPLWPLGLALSLAFLVDAYLPSALVARAALALALLFSLVYLVARQRTERSLAEWALTWVPPLYSGFLLAFLVSLRLLPHGERWLYLVLGVAWSTDVAAYFVGRAFGRRSFFARVSPRKTLEGAVGGLAAGTLCGVVLGGIFGWGIGRAILFSLLGAAMAEAGDLAESLMKRQLQTKDASRLIPGHGGMLDRLDSLLFVGVFSYFWAIWIGGNP